MARLIAEGETLTPRRSSHIWQCCSLRVASSFSSSCSHNALLSSALARRRRYRPVEVPGERSSPTLRFLIQRLSVVREMEKVWTMSFLGIFPARAHRAPSS
jgi:hypothetical protein